MEKDIRDEELAAMQAEGEEEVICVVLTDEQGNEHEFYQDMVITVDDKQFAVLVPMEDCCCEDDDCDCHEHDEEEDTCVIARMDFDETAKLFTPLRLTKNTKQLLLSMTKCLRTRSNSQSIILPDFGPVFLCDVTMFSDGYRKAEKAGTRQSGAGCSRCFGGAAGCRRGSIYNLS